MCATANLLLKPFTPHFSIGREQRGTREAGDPIKEEKQEIKWTMSGQLKGQV